MRNKLSPEQADFFRRVDELMFYIWDPIGINDIPEARYEYYSYIPEIFALVENNASSEALSDYLSSISMANMGLRANKERDKRVAEYILEWARVLGLRKLK